MKGGFTGILGAILLLGVQASPAKADLKLCNNTASRVGVAIGYKDKNGGTKDREAWATEGWWTAEPNKCLNLLNGPLISRYYYVYAVDYEKGGSVLIVLIRAGAIGVSDIDLRYSFAELNLALFCTSKNMATSHRLNC